jgi:hypothetical protein
MTQAHAEWADAAVRARGFRHHRRGPEEAGGCGVHNCGVNAFSTKKQIVEAKAEKVIQSVAALVPMGFCRANDYYYQQRRDMLILTTGSTELDKLLGGASRLAL